MQSQGTQPVQKDDKLQDNYRPEKPALHLVLETIQETTVVTGEKVENITEYRRQEQKPAVTAYYWCRICHQKAPITNAKSCDCGVTMCNSCWAEWDSTCPICEADMR